MAKIENVSIDIRIGKKEYHIKNLILDTLLNRFANSLIYDRDTAITKHIRRYKSMRYCLLKLDTPITPLYPQMAIKNNQFDLGISGGNFDYELSTNKATMKYEYISEDIIDFNETSQMHKISEYKGRKICTLGFNYYWYLNEEINAIVDLSNYDIYIEEGESIYITRIDTISNNAIFTSSNLNIVKGPVHFLPEGINAIPIEGKSVPSNAYAKISSIGLSNNSNRIERSLDLEYEVNSNIFTLKNLYSPSGLFPSNELYPSDEVYLDDKPYKYIVIKFCLYEDIVENEVYSEIDTGVWYLQAIPLDKKQEINLNIKYERG